MAIRELSLRNLTRYLHQFHIQQHTDTPWYLSHMIKALQLFAICHYPGHMYLRFLEIQALASP